MKKLLTFLLLLLFIIGGLLFYLQDHLRLITGTAAKRMCSCVFVADRTAESVDASVDKAKKIASATVLGMAKQTAVYREGLGCALVSDGYTTDQLRAISVPALQTSLSRVTSNNWPMGNKMVDSLLPAFDQAKLTAALAYAFENPALKTRAVVVLKENFDQRRQNKHQ